jgi:tRNA U55 pseudouridine synthase TruB
MRQGHLCALAGPRHRPRSRLLSAMFRSLRRVEVEPFTPEDFVTIAELEAARFGVQEEDSSDATNIVDTTETVDVVESANGTSTAIDALLVDTSAALDCLPQIAISDDAATKIRLGNPGYHSWSRCTGGSRGSLRDSARQAGCHRRHRARHVQAQAGLHCLTLVLPVSFPNGSVDRTPRARGIWQRLRPSRNGRR